METLGCDQDGYPGYLARVCRLVAHGFGQDDPRVLAKNLWLHGLYVAAIDGFDAVKINQRFERENPEIVDDIRGLPRFDAEAERAVAIVRAAGP